MAAHCWGCEVGVPAIGSVGPPIGTCWVCGVWGCVGHAERDAGSLKWHCYPSVATALASSAGLPDVTSETRFDSTEDAQRRFPVVMNAIRRGWMPSDVRGVLESKLPEIAGNLIDESMLALALDLSEFLLPKGSTERQLAGQHPIVLPTVLLVLLSRG